MGCSTWFRFTALRLSTELRVPRVDSGCGRLQKYSRRPVHTVPRQKPVGSHCHVILRDQYCHDSCRAPPGKIQICRHRADIVGMADDKDLELAHPAASVSRSPAEQRRTRVLRRLCRYRRGMPGTTTWPLPVSPPERGCGSGDNILRQRRFLEDDLAHTVMVSEEVEFDPGLALMNNEVALSLGRILFEGVAGGVQGG